MLNVEQIQALNAEIVALRKANIPIDLGLPGSREATERALSAADAELRHQVESGHTTEQALDVVFGTLPPRYRQVVLTGSRSGRLPQTMETIARHLRRLADIRISIATSLIYPLIICVLAYGFLVFLCSTTLPRILQIFAQLLGESDAAASLWFVEVLERYFPVVVLLPPVFFLLLLFFWWRSAKQGTSSLEKSMGLLSWLPGIRRIVRDTQLAGTADIAAALVENEVPPHDAVNTASRAVVGRDFDARAPFLEWALKRTNEPSSEAASSLQLAAELYGERALQRAEWMRVVVPYALIVFVAGGAVLFYAATFWRPFCQFMFDISDYSAPFLN